MTLKYLREYSLGSQSSTSNSAKRKKPLSKKKFFILLAINLALWLCVSGFYLEINPGSIKESWHEFSKRKGLLVTGVVCNSKMQAAIISEEVYKVGDTVKGYTVIEINKEGVEFKKGKKQVFKKVTSVK